VLGEGRESLEVDNLVDAYGESRGVTRRPGKVGVVLSLYLWDEVASSRATAVPQALVNVFKSGQTFASDYFS